MELRPVRLDIEGFRRNILKQGTPERVYRRVRNVLDICLPGGGYCHHHWVTSYIPVDNYLVVLDKGRGFGQA